MAHFLANNKRLAISIAVNLLLICALSILLHLVYPQFLYELSTVSNWDRYSVRTYRDYSNGTACFEILMGPSEYIRQPKVPRRIYSHSGHQAFFVEAFGVDLTGNGVPDLVVRQWSGSAHGDSRYLVLELDGSVVKEIDVIDGLLDAEFRDVNNDGVVEITGKDKSYSLFLGDSYSDSPRPRVVLSFDQSRQRFVLNRSLMSRSPLLLSDQLEKLCVKYRNDGRWHTESRPPAALFDTMLGLIYGGNEEQAWGLFDASWPDGSPVPKDQYRETIQKELRQSPFPKEPRRTL